MGCFLEKLMGAPMVKQLLSDEHFSVDCTLLKAWHPIPCLAGADLGARRLTATAVRAWQGL